MTGFNVSRRGRRRRRANRDVTTQMTGFNKHEVGRGFKIQDPDTGKIIMPTMREADEAVKRHDVRVSTWWGDQVTVPKNTTMFETDPGVYIPSYLKSLSRAMGGDVFEQGVVKLGKKEAPTTGEWVRDSVNKRYYTADQAKDIVRARRAYNSEPHMHRVFRTYQKAIAYWKMEKLFLIPAYHVRNVIGNMWNNSLASNNFMADAPAWGKAYKSAARLMKRVGDDTANESEKALYREMVERGVARSQSFTLDSARGAAQGATTLNPLSTRFAGFRTGMNVAQSLEDWARIAHYMWARGKGMGKEKAAASVNKHLFDYSDLTDFETKVRDFVPFYTWTRKNLPLQLEMAVTNPNRYRNLAQGAVEWQSGFGEESDIAGLPPWVSGEQTMNMPVPITLPGDDPGKRRYLDLFQYLPTGDLSRIGDEGPLAALGPLPKALIELGTGVSTFTGAPLERYEGEKGHIFGQETSIPRKELEVAKSQFRTLGLLEHAAGAVAPSLANPPRSDLAPRPDIYGALLRSTVGSLSAVDSRQVAATLKRDAENLQRIRSRAKTAKKEGRMLDYRRLQNEYLDKLHTYTIQRKQFSEDQRKAQP